MNNTFTYTYTRTNAFTNTITNTNTHTNLPLRKSLLDKGLLEYVVRKSSRKIGPNNSVDFNHISYPPTLPDRLIKLILSGRTPCKCGFRIVFGAKDTLTTVTF
jgi:hypothetical protein